MNGYVALRDVEQEDLPVFFHHQTDPEANAMAAFTAPDPTDRQAFMAHCAKILADANILMQTVLLDGRVAGNIVSFMSDGQREIGYWIGTEYWGRGVASAALAAFLRRETRRPLLAYAAKDNAASIRVLLKCGFILCREARSYSNARAMVVDEVVMTLGPQPQIDTGSPSETPSLNGPN